MKIDVMTKDKDTKTVVPALRFPEFSENGEWTIVPLKKHAKLITEKAKNRNYIPLSVTSGVGLVSQMEKFGREIAGEQYKNYYVINKFDFAYNKSATTSYPEGYISMLKNFDRGAVPNSIFTCFSVDKNEINPQYLDQLFQDNFHGKWLRNYIEIGSRANGALSIDSKILLNMLIPLPKLKEQLKIKDCLSCLDDLISAVADKIETLKEYKKGLMQQLFPAEGKTTPAFRFPEFQNAGEWKDTTLGEEVYYENGKAHENDINETGKYIVVNSKFISTDGEVVKYTDNPSCLANKGDILMVLSDVPNGRAIAKCFIVDCNNKYTVNQRVCKLTPKKAVALLLYYSINRNPFLLAFDDGIKQTNLKKDDVLNCLFRLPQESQEQQRIADCLLSVDELISTEIAKLDQLKAHKKGLMQQLFPKLQ
ncbi:restriction endonuclease subunit S [Parabacteroides johnsonii]|uniref:restriction endonuclease subunit S n=1 Tax=Parabacteroides johnsonii TaxID=387661 RepID=UPI00266D7ED8|nr:restriction endonuclease subunit S [Parabacteroides johnsonii]